MIIIECKVPFKNPKMRVGKDVIYTPQPSKNDLLYESIAMPQWNQFVTIDDIDSLYWAATTHKLSANFDKKKQYMNSIMGNRGFKFMAGGTNRICYKHLEFPGIVAKVPIDKVGMSDNMAEEKNQKMLWPYCSKMMQVTPGGVIGFAERVEPILNRLEFNSHSAMIYSAILEIVGEYVLEDIGTDYFKNWGIRKGFGPVLLDYPYVFELDGNKLYCNANINGFFCGGEIDYDIGFNHLYCTRCGKEYNAADLRLQIKSEMIVNKPILKGGVKPMYVQFKKGSQVISTSNSSNTITKPDDLASDKTHNNVPGEVSRVRFSKGNKILADTIKPADSVIKQTDSNEQEAKTVTDNNGMSVTSSEISIIGMAEESIDNESPKPYISLNDEENSIIDNLVETLHAEEEERAALSDNESDYEEESEESTPVDEIDEESIVEEEHIPEEPKDDASEEPKEEENTEPESELPAVENDAQEEYTASENNIKPNDFPPNPWSSIPKNKDYTRRIINNTMQKTIVRRKQNNPYDKKEDNNG